ncbi:MAG: MATE family efflux transporter [Alphaproteobacteria bacterium]|nr:MATE family efflux transporter [Alphaproteobacteria bacterium]
MVIGIFAIMSISLADTYYVGQLGTNPLAALSFTFPVSLTISSLAIGLSAGAGSVVSRSIGVRDEAKTCRRSTDSIVLAIFIVMLISVIGYFTIRPLFSALGASGEVLDIIVRYMRIWYISMPFMIIPMVANALIRAAGDSFWPSMVMTISAIINIVITPAFVFGFWVVPAMDVEGAAIGTMIARMVSFAMALWLLIYREKMISLVLPPLQDFITSCVDIVKIAIPAAIGNAVNPIGVAVVTAIIATFGNEAVAAFGPATRIESMICIPMFALSAAIGPMAGQNWGAGDKARVKTALAQSFGFCVAWSLLMALLLYFTADFISAIFVDEPAVQNKISRYLILVPISLSGYGITMVAAGCFNAIGRPLTGLSTYLLRTAAFYIPLSWLASVMFSDIEAVFIAIAVSNALAAVGVAIFAFWRLARLEPQHS